MSATRATRPANAGSGRILVVNAGSSTLKAAVIEPGERRPVTTVLIDWAGDSPGASVTRILREVEAGGVAIDSVAAVGYRVVHGGTRFVAPTLIDDEALEAFEELADLAPLHTRRTIEVMRAGRKALPRVPHVAAFDTAFHAGLPPAAFRYPVPEAWFRDWGIRRFGFHGLSVSWSLFRTAEILGRPAESLRLVIAHLGSGCSVTAVSGGKSVDTSMGMTPLEGLAMGTRAGSLDPGILLAILRDRRATPAELEEALDHRSGLLGLSGRSADVRDLLAAEGNGDEPAALALEVFVRRAAAGIAAAASCLPVVDALVFTGGIGERSGAIRARISARLATLGVAAIPVSEVDEDCVLASGADAPAILRIEAREDLVIAEAARELLERTLGNRWAPGRVQPE